MKKTIALILAAVILCSCAAALAETPAMPYADTFASMTTVTKGDKITITLSKAVNKLYVNWPNDLKLVELAVTPELKASVYTIGQTTQPGVAEVVTLYVNGDRVERPVGTKLDRAFITLQGEWIVSYNRHGDIVDITYAGAGDIQAIRNVAFKLLGEVSTGRLILNSPRK